MWGNENVVKLLADIIVAKQHGLRRVDQVTKKARYRGLSEDTIDKYSSTGFFATKITSLEKRRIQGRATKIRMENNSMRRHLESDELRSCL